jgi:S1/P1 Nuclease
MFRKLLLVATAALVAAGPSLAWNRAGHMVMGAITFDDLQHSAPATVARVVAILRQHPQYESRWKPQIASVTVGMSEEDQARFLFMLAARWPDDIRGDKAFDHPMWHYIDYPYKPPAQPASVLTPAPAAENIVEAFQRNVAVVQSAAPDAEKAVALCWIFHLMGDAHQPLHAVSLFTTEFPKGDQGGNLFFIRADPSNPQTRSLHSYWDGILLADDQYGPARIRAAKIEGYQDRVTSKKPAESRFEKWTHESFDLAVSGVYRKGKLKISTDKDAGTPLPRNYHAAAERIATRQIALASDRLADFLQATFPQH